LKRYAGAESDTMVSEGVLYAESAVDEIKA
jgi:hypothetical protein